MGGRASCQYPMYNRPRELLEEKKCACVRVCVWVNDEQGQPPVPFPKYKNKDKIPTQI